MTKDHLIRRKNKYVVRLRKARIHHKLAFSLIGALGVIFIWKGVWDLLDTKPFLGHSLEVIAVGVIFSAISGALFKLF